MPAEPLFLRGLAVRGHLFGVWLLLLWNLPLFAAVIVFAPAWNQVLLSQAPGLAVVGIAQYKTGVWIARRSVGREIAGCSAGILISLAFRGVVGVCLGPVPERYAQSFNPQPSLTISIGTLTLSSLVGYGAWYAGAIGVRRQLIS